MRKFLKKNILEIFQTMYEAHNDIKKLIEKKEFDSVNIILGDCQNTAVQIGTAIESSEGEGFVSVKYLEEYCEAVYQVASEVAEFTGSRAQKALNKKLIKSENSVKNDIKVMLEVVFFPYKASMWDSLESIWMAADADPDCNAHVIPIPYFDRNPDYSLGEMHYEGAELPEYVPLMHFEAYNLELMRPDVIYIHNPYDEYNNVTSVDPRYYSHELKKYTDCLVYVPYYATAGGMGEAQKSLSAYFYADYIVSQSERHKTFFDERIQNKLLPFGSPKFDRVINICNNPPAAPAEWADIMTGKKIFFYNTSLGGMLADTEVFLKKMQYVFETFAKHPEVCLLWRPHPLIESTFDSMRPGYKKWFLKLKEFFIVNKLGIYDNTPDITNTIALSDCYIGDSGTSVTSLFGMAGKPMFILNNSINTFPENDDWRGEFIKGVNSSADIKWLVTSTNELYYSASDELYYKYVCKLSEYSGGGYYSSAITCGNKTFICPANGHEVIEVSPNGIKKRIKLNKSTDRPSAYMNSYKCGKYIFLIPFNAEDIIRLDTTNYEVTYISGYKDFFIKNINGQILIGGITCDDNNIFFSSPTEKQILKIKADNCAATQISVSNDNSGYSVIDAIDDMLIMLPLCGYNVSIMNISKGTVHEYNAYVDGIQCFDQGSKAICDNNPFYHPALYEEYLYLPPWQANKFVRVNIVTGEAEEWIPPFEQLTNTVNGYYNREGADYFIKKCDPDNKYLFYSHYNAKMYSVDLKNNSFKDCSPYIDVDELKQHEPGFSRLSEWLQYGCMENCFNSLNDFIENNTCGNQFNKSEQISAFSSNAANPDGTCGIKTHEFIKNKALN